MKPHIITYDICRCYLRDHSSKLAPGVYRKVEGFLRARHLPALASCSSLFDPTLHGINTWKTLRQIECFFKKNQSFTSPDSAAIAWDSFMLSEQQCAATNLTLDYCYSKRDRLDPDLAYQMSQMKSYIRRVLGDFQEFLNDLPSLVRVTSGATSSTTRKDSLPQLKMKMKIFAPEGSWPYLKALYKFFGFKTPKCRPCDINRVESVPKNFATDRTIACEPEGALPLQLAFDAWVKKRLKKFGIDLSDQSANANAALTGSLAGDLATVDHERASDTVAYAPVVWLFPEPWVKFLCSIRSKRYHAEQFSAAGSYQKFSSMGNGSTFCIETLLFAASCYAVGSERFLVYGDDVIIESELFPAYLKLTTFLGFTINLKKTHVHGPIRESCGTEAYLGEDVTPVYIRHIDGRKAVLCHLVNTLASLCFPGSELGAYLEKIIKEYKLNLVPYSENSMSGVWVHPEHPVVQRVVKVRHSIPMYKAWLPSCKRIDFQGSRGYYLWFLARQGQVRESLPWILTDDIRGLRIKVTTSSQTSSAPVFRHKYVRKWVCWHMPAVATPDHLRWWLGANVPPLG